MTKAIVRTSTNRVVTFVRWDLPDGWTPPAGCHAVEESSLPVGWQYEEAPAPVPMSITAAQLRLWLLGRGLIESVATVISALPEELRAAYEIMWEYETTFTRDNPQMLAIADALGLSSADVDTAFREAALL